MALLGFVVLGGLMLLAIFTFCLGTPLRRSKTVAIAPESGFEVSFDPGRAAAGLGGALFFSGAALWIIKRTDWSLDEP